jgi:hypothetical protein
LTCCDLWALEDHLENGTKENLWNPLEDMALKLEPDTIEYKYLLSTKGQEKMDRRTKFLQDEEDANEPEEESEEIEIEQEIVEEAEESKDIDIDDEN